jgi:hypothetical protein
VVRLVKDKFVAVAIDGRIANTRKDGTGRDIPIFSDSETDFLREHKVKLAASAQGSVDTITASGKHLEYPELHPAKGAFKASLYRALKAYAELPASARAPGAVKVPDRGPIDPKRVVAVAPPPDALIVRVNNRQLGRNAKGELRYTVPEDYITALRDPKLGFVPDARGAVDYYRQPSDDMLWIIKEEWQAMMPAKPRPGQRVPVPASLRERIFKYHLDPMRGLGESENFASREEAKREGELHLTVEDANSGEVRLRLDGFAKLFNPRSAQASFQGVSITKFSQFTVGSQFGYHISYQPRLLGYLAYDPTAKRFTRLDIVALGDVHGNPGGESVVGERLGAENPLGIAFSLITDPKPADYLRPKALGNGEWFDLPGYLCVPKK